MSYEVLEQLQAAHAFDPAPRRVDLGAACDDTLDRIPSQLITTAAVG
ncbi:MAG TPA: hypothetical protein VGA69_12800 [Nitriliruptorales bacterium]